METENNHHTESLSQAHKQFQAKIRNLEDKKSSLQVSAEQKDKDIHNLKEELKSLQLLKYNLEKKLRELEQKLVLQSRSKDCHLNQLGEVEQRFSALSRQCATVKQAHHKLEQNADEAMKLNKQLTSTNEKQEATIESLNKEVEELRNKLVKAKLSFISHDTTEDNPSIKEQTIQQLQKKLNMECEMNRRFKDENKALQAEKHDMLRSLEVAHELLSNQTQAAGRLELDLQTQRQQYESLERDHRTTQGKEKAMEEKIQRLAQEYAVSKNNWDKEKAEFLEQMKNEQRELVTVKEAFDELQHKHNVLSSKAKEQETHINELKRQALVKDLDLSVLPYSTVEGGSHDGDRSFTETTSNTDLSNTDALTMADDSVEPKDNVATAAIRGQEDEQNGGPMSEILFEPHSNLVNLGNSLSVTVFRESITLNSSVRNNVQDLISTSVFSESSVKSNCAHINSATSEEFDFANTIVENGLHAAESGEACLKNDGASFIEREKTLENCEDANASVAVESEAQKNDEDKGMTDTGDDATDTTMFITENVAKEHGKVEESSSLEAERQLQTTETAIDENQPELTEDKGTITQVSPLKLSSVDGKVVPALPFQDVTSPATETPPSPVRHDSGKQTTAGSEESTSTELPETLHKSSLCQRQSDAAQLDGVTVKMQTQVVSPPDTRTHDKDSVDNSAKECSTVTEDVVCPQSPAEIPELKLYSNDSVACGMGKSLKNGSENNCENKEVHILDISNLKCRQPVGQGSTKHMESQKEFVSVLKLSKSKDLLSWPSESELKTYSFKSPERPKSPIEKEAKTMDEFAAHIKTTFRSSFEWSCTQRRAQMSQISPSNPKGYSGHAPVTVPTFLRGKCSKEPLTIAKATDVLSGSSAASSWRLSEWKALGEAHRDTAPTESRVSQSYSLVSSSFSKISKPEEQKRSLSPDASRSPDTDCDPSCSQDTEEQQSSFRAQISKIEQFLGTERLRLPKRRKTEN